MLVEKDIKDIYVWVEAQPPLCFTANTAGSTVKLTRKGYPPNVSLEISTDYQTWTTYNRDDTITLAHVGDMVYMRNKSETDVQFSANDSNYYYFKMTGSISASGDVTSLLNKSGTNTLSEYCFSYLFDWCTSLTTAPSLPATTLADSCYYFMFNGCTSLTTAPKLPATTLTNECYYYMFYWCTSLTELPSLPATTLADSCYFYMFSYCSNIKLSTTKTGEYQTEYRIPTLGTGTSGTNSLYYMFAYTGGTFTGTPKINTTYYTSNTVV